MSLPGFAFVTHSYGKVKKGGGFNICLYLNVTPFILSQGEKGGWF